MIANYDDGSFFWKVRMVLIWTIAFVGFPLWMPLWLFWRAFIEKEDVR